MSQEIFAFTLFGLGFTLILVIGWLSWLDIIRARNVAAEKQFSKTSLPAKILNKFDRRGKNVLTIVQAATVGGTFYILTIKPCAKLLALIATQPNLREGEIYYGKRALLFLIPFAVIVMMWAYKRLRQINQLI